MRKSGIIYRHILEELQKRGRRSFVEREIARELGLSPDTVSRAIAPLKRMGVAAVGRTSFDVYGWKKLLLFWASNRRLDRDVSYGTFTEVRDIAQIEDRLPDGIAYTSFSAYVKCFGNDAADYGEVYAYATEDAREETERRFPPKRGPRGYSNLVLLEPDPILRRRIEGHALRHSSVSMQQMYVDLWNNDSMSAYEFVKRLEKRMDDIYAKAILEPGKY